MITADEQTAGRGRGERRWWAPAGSALLASLLLRDPVAERPAWTLAFAAAVAVCDVVGEEACVKWPNDVIRPRSLRKLAGILLESRHEERWVVLGIGLNVAVDLDALPSEVAVRAATLDRPAADVEPVLADLLSALSVRLQAPSEEILAAWRARDALLGREIRWDGGSGEAEGVDDSGRLLVRSGGGAVARLSSGEVHLL